MPEGRPMWLRRCCVRNTALTTMASVIAICSATRMAPARLRSNAERMGRISMSLHLEVGSGGGTPDAPGGIESRGEARRNGDGDDDQEVGLVERQRARCLFHEAPVPGAQRPDAG